MSDLDSEKSVNLFMPYTEVTPPDRVLYFIQTLADFDRRAGPEKCMQMVGALIGLGGMNEVHPYMITTLFPQWMRFIDRVSNDPEMKSADDDFGRVHFGKFHIPALIHRIVDGRYQYDESKQPICDVGEIDLIFSALCGQTIAGTAEDLSVNRQGYYTYNIKTRMIEYVDGVTSQKTVQAPSEGYCFGIRIDFAYNDEVTNYRVPTLLDPNQPLSMLAQGVIIYQPDATEEILRQWRLSSTIPSWMQRAAKGQKRPGETREGDTLATKVISGILRKKP